MNQYELMYQQAIAFTQDARPESALVNILSLVYWSDPHINWAGLYLTDGYSIWLGPFQGRPACMSIPWNKGVVGTCAANELSLYVPDVHQFQGHIACDSTSRSEVVVPIKKDGRLAAILDIDSDQTDHFCSDSILAFEKISLVLAGLL